MVFYLTLNFFYLLSLFTFAGDLDLELVTSTDLSHPLAKCFSSMTVSILSDCTLTLTANGQNNFVQALWSAADTYSQVEACPTGVSKDFVDEATATAEAGLASLLATSIYTSGMSASVASVTASSGIISVTSGSATLKFRASAKSGSVTVRPVSQNIALSIFLPGISLNLATIYIIFTSFISIFSLFTFILQAGIFSVGAPTCSASGECAATAAGCDAGHYPVGINTMTTYVCALCSSGTYSSAGDTSCTKVAAGKALAAVGSTSDTSSACDPGTFATLGSSDCRPCAPGM